MDADEGLDPADEGRVLESDGVAVLRFERSLPAPPARVWEAITTPDLSGRWAYRTELEPRAGGALRFTFGEGMSVDGEVIACDEPHVLEYAWSAPDGRWRVSYAIEPVGDGTRLAFEHHEPDPHVPDYAAGWHWHLDRLRQLLEGEQPAAVDSDPHFEELQRLYAHAGG